MSPPPNSERVDKYGAALILGKTPRAIVQMAHRLPGAAKIGRNWTFDIKKIREFVRVKEIEKCQADAGLLPDVIGKAKSYGAARWLRPTATAGRFTQTIQKLREKGARRDAKG